ncbi:SusC/RagA family TonB-linked outer membrane protein [Polaribacter dokdonensis]|uniref:TonB dependent/ligand-gated channel n=1 Tax=Polaribacter dokdonensis DSW-5 TaxID=1300348 RepID=A0A0M9CEI2_9FLAO|nr:SusC/RagA family TonB-linked outer membrane protein [Polaribacter dokdonensis]KOY50912.1 TonB dependent/ligand-gated channel [Polaribacter dokdonensis DSW-5]SEE23010.1 TonB-linked outer membrane protein, SusC/RagA family [Polaribacter dokdonensis DSW-5]
MKTKFNGILTLLLAFVVQISFAQEKTVSGTVSDESGSLPGVSVIIKGSTKGTETDFDGKYSIQAKTGDVLVFRYLGYKASERTVGSSNVINVKLAEDANVLDEIVVVGYGTSTKQAFVGTAAVVKQEQLEVKNFSNVSQALTGEVAGVTVINSSGQPGTVGAIRIRGYGSVNGNRAPLYVVDGVPFSGSINSINPSDIASTTILKDATATAIYGSRGANGVVLITTKGGSASNSYIEVDIKTGVNDQLIPRYDVVTNPEEYIGYVWEGIKNRGVVTGNPDPVAFANANLFTGNYVAPGYNMWNVTSGADLIDPTTGTVRPGVTRKYTPLRYADVAFDSAIRTETNLRMGGGNQDTRYFASFGYLDDNGYSINTSFKRYTTRLNLTSDVKPWLKLNSNIGYAYSENIANGQIAGSENVFEFADKMAPIFPVFLRDDNAELVPDLFYGGFQYDYGSLSGFRDRPNANGLNPIGSAKYDFNGTDRHEMNGNFSATFKFTDNLSAEIRYGVQYATQKNRDYTNKFYGGGQATSGDITINDFSSLTQNILQIIKYNNTWGNHSFDALVAHESNDFEQNFASASKGLQISPFLYDLDNFQSSLGLPSGSTSGFTIESYFSQFNYNFDQKYYFSASVRADGSSRFVNDKWGTFGSVGASWIVSNEDFLQDSFISYLKLKASYGITGDQAGVGFFSGYNTFNGGNLGGSISLAPGANGNPDLTWETTNQFQVGAEMSFGKYLDVNLDYYNKLTDNLIFNRFVGPSQGISSITVNDGELVNSGLEFDITGHLVDNKDFTLDLSVNGEIVNNEILTMPLDPATNEPQLLTPSGFYARSEGRSIFDFYMREWAGVDPADGAPMWYQYYDDVNNNGVLDAGEPSSYSSGSWVPADPAVINNTGSIVEYQIKVPGANIKKTVTKTYSDASDVYADKSAIADVRGAFRLSGKLGNFNFGTQFTYSLGGYAYDAQYAELMSDRFGAVGNNYHKDIANRWQNPGDITDVPALTDNAIVNGTSTSTRFITSTDFIALNNVNIGYNIPKQYLDKISVQTVNIWFSADNLFNATARQGFLPSTSESGNSGRRLYAPMTTMTLGVRVKF